MMEKINKSINIIENHVFDILHIIWRNNRFICLTQLCPYNLIQFNDCKYFRSKDQRVAGGVSILTLAIRFK